VKFIVSLGDCATERFEGLMFAMITGQIVGGLEDLSESAHWELLVVYRQRGSTDPGFAQLGFLSFD